MPGNHLNGITYIPAPPLTVSLSDISLFPLVLWTPCNFRIAVKDHLSKAELVLAPMTAFAGGNLFFWSAFWTSVHILLDVRYPTNPQ